MPEASNEAVRVTREDDHNRYAVYVDDALAGFTQFRPANAALRFVHTEIDPTFAGRGLASILVSQAMADLAARGETVVPLCPFVAAYLQRHEVPGLTIAWPEQS